ncbi:MAG: sulfotransferase [Candidatus Promineofilum sp.]|nr:sulfotransferase [Promineifilum sp.]
MAQSSLRRGLTRATARTYHELRHRAQDSGLLPASADYARFICVGDPRTGSTLLMRSLNNHSRIIGYGEIVKSIDRYPGHYHEFGNREALFQRHPVEFLETKVFRRYSPGIEAVGFKIFYHHAPRETAWGQAVWDYLVGQPQLKVLRLKRHNLLKTFLSRKQAGLTGEYIKYSGTAPAVDLDAAEAREFFERTRAAEAEYDLMFAGHALLEVVYEDLTRDYAAMMGRIQSFLGVAYENIDPGTEKRPSRSLSSQIANYSQLREQFQASPWETFFSE